MNNLRYKKENNEVKKMIYNIYENNKLMKKIRKKNTVISLDEIEEIIIDSNYFNSEIEKDENVAKLNFEYIIDIKIRIKKKNLEIINNELCKNEFNTLKFRSKERKNLYRKNIVKINHYSFLVTEKFKSFQRIKKIITNRKGIVLCYNKLNEIVCIYFLFFYGDLTYDIIDILNETSFSSNINRKLDEIYKEKILNEEKCSICQENMIGYIKL